MKINKRLIGAIVWIAVGIVLTLCSFWDLVDSYWAGMGSALLFIGILQLVRLIRYRKDPSYREEVDTQNKDERNRYIATKAWSWSGYLFVIIAAIASIALKALGYDDYSQFAGFSVCLILVLYWISYIILRKKY